MSNFVHMLLNLVTSDKYLTSTKHDSIPCRYNVLAILLLCLTFGVGQILGTDLKTSDLDFGTPGQSENFNAVNTVSTTGKSSSTTTVTNYTTYGIFTHGYIGKSTSDGYAIKAAADPMSSKYLEVTTTTKGAGMSFSYSFATKGAFSFTIAKTSATFIGIYGAVANNTIYAKANSSVYLYFTGSKIQINSGSGWVDAVTDMSGLPNTFDVTVIYNNTTTAAEYGDDVSIGAKRAHIFVNGTAVMDGSSPKEFTIPGASLTAFRVMYNAAGTAKVDDIKVYDALPGAAETCTSLASINGSVSWSNGSKATLLWDKMSNVDATTPYTITYKTGSGSYGSTNVSAIRDTVSNTKKTCTITGLTAGNSYDFKIAVTAANNYCNKDSVITSTAPKITASATLTGSNYAEGSGPGTVKNFSVSGVGLTGAITVTAPTNFEVCKTSDGTYTSSVSYTPSSGTLSSTTVYIRLAAGLSQNDYDGNVTISGGGAANNTSVSIAGTVGAACHTPSISVQPAASASYNLNVSATALSITAAKGDAGDPTLTYQWYSNTANSKTTPTPTAIDDATSSTYTPLTTTSGTTYYFCEVSSGACSITSDISAITVNTPTLSIGDDKTAIAFGDRAKDGSYELTFTVSGSNLAYNTGISLALSGTNASLFSIDKTSISQTSSGAVSSTTVTVTYSPNVAGDHSATLTISSSGATSKVLSLTGSSKWVVTWKVNGSTSTTTYVANSSKPVPPSAPANNTLNNCANKFVGWSCKSWGSTPKGTGTGEYDDLFTSSDYSTKGPSITKDTVLYAVFAESVGAAESTVMWSEEFTGISSNGKITAPSAKGSSVYESASITYTMTDGSGTGKANTEVKSGDSYAGSSAPELMIGKGGTSAGSFQIAGIPNGGAAELTLTFKKNDNTLTPTISTAKYSISKESGSGAGIWEYKITCGDGAASSFTLLMTGSTGSNVRVDSLVVKVRTANYSNYVTQCAANQVRVTYDFNGGTGTACTEGVTTTNANYTVCSTTPTKTGYDFNKWSDGTNSYTAGATGYNLASTTMFTAQWKAKTYTITYKDQGGSAYSGTNGESLPGTHTYGSATALVNGAKGNGYRFDGWYSTSACTGDPITSFAADAVLQDTTLYAKWTVRHEIVFDIYGVGTTTIYRASDENIEDAVGVGSKPSNPDAPSTCSTKTFVGWVESEIDDETDTDPATLTDATGMVTEDKHYYATWAIKSGTAIAAVEDDSFTSKDESGGYGSATYSFKAANKYLQQQSIWDSDDMTNVKVKIRVYHFSNSKADVLRVSLINSSGTEVTGADLNTSKFGTSISSGGWSDYVELTPTTAVTGYKVYMKTLNSSGTGINKIEREVVNSYSKYATGCCSTKVTLSGGSPTNGTVTFAKSTLQTCDEDKTVKMTITPASGYQLHTFSVATGDGKVATKSMSADVDLDNNSNAAQEIDLTFAEDANGAYNVTATFTEMTATSWTWTEHASETEVTTDPIDIYVGQKIQVDITYSPAGLLSSHTSNTAYAYDPDPWSNSYLGSPSKAGDKFTVTGTNAGSTSVVLNHNDGLTKTIYYNVISLPLVHFKDLIHGETFADVKADVSADKFTVTMTRNTPTHDDLAEPGSGNTCEKKHLHLIGWIRSDYPALAAYMNGTGSLPGSSAITSAGNDASGNAYFFAPNASINVDDLNGKTFYAVWATIE